MWLVYVVISPRVIHIHIAISDKCLCPNGAIHADQNTAMACTTAGWR